MYDEWGQGMDYDVQFQKPSLLIVQKRLEVPVHFLTHIGREHVSPEHLKQKVLSEDSCIIKMDLKPYQAIG